MKRWVLAALAAITLFTAACGSDGDGDEETSRTTRTSAASSATSAGEGGGTTTTVDETKQPFSRPIPAHVTIEVKGSVDFEWEEDVPDLRVLTFRPPKHELTLISVGLADFKSLGGNEKFRTAFDLVGAYKGAGKYTLKAGGGSVTTVADPEKASAAGVDLSTVFVTYVKMKDPNGQVTRDNLEVGNEYNRNKRACSIEIGDDVESGSITCPEIADEKSGGKVSLEMTWEPIED